MQKDAEWDQTSTIKSFSYVSQLIVSQLDQQLFSVLRQEKVLICLWKMNLNKLITKFVDYAMRVMFAPGGKRTCAFPRVMVAQIDEARLLKGNDE